MPLSLGAIAGMFTAKAVPECYATLIQPSFNPPNWVFGPIWAALYIILGFSFPLIWKQKRSIQRNKAISMFLVQIALNFQKSIKARPNTLIVLGMAMISQYLF